MSNTNINPIVALALSKVDIDKAIRATIAPSAYTGEATVKIAYDLKVGADFEQVVAASIPWQRLACLALSKLNGDCIDAVIREAAASTSASEVEDAIAARAKKVVGEVQAAATRKVSGKVTGNVSVEVLS